MEKKSFDDMAKMTELICSIKLAAERTLRIENLPSNIRLEAELTLVAYNDILEAINIAYVSVSVLSDSGGYRCSNCDEFYLEQDIQSERCRDCGRLLDWENIIAEEYIKE